MQFVTLFSYARLQSALQTGLIKRNCYSVSTSVGPVLCCCAVPLLQTVTTAVPSCNCERGPSMFVPKTDLYTASTGVHGASFVTGLLSE